MVMSIKFLCLTSSVLFVSCLTDDDFKRTEKWYLDNWEASIFCGISSGSIDPDEEVQEKNKILETLLGLEDSCVMETELHLGGDGEMHIVKNDVITLSGRWNNPSPHFLTLTANDQSWNFDLINKNEDSIVLRARNYKYIEEVNVVLKAGQRSLNRDSHD